MAGSDFSAQNKETHPFWVVFGRAVFIGTEQSVFERVLVSLDLRLVGQK